MADIIPPAVTPLQSAYPTLAPGASQGASTSTATETPMGATKRNPFGIEKEGLIEREASNKAIADLTNEQGENGINRAVLGQETAEAKQTAGAGDLTELHKFHDEWKNDFAARRERAQKMEDSIAATAKFHDHFTDKNVGDKIIAVLASAALGFGTGRPQNVVADIENQEHVKQEKQLAALMQTAQLMGANDEQLRKTYDDAEGHMKLARALRLEAIANEFDKQAAMATTLEKQTEMKMASAVNRKNANEERLGYEQHLRNKSSRAATTATKPVAPVKRY